MQKRVRPRVRNPQLGMMHKQSLQNLHPAAAKFGQKALSMAFWVSLCLPRRLLLPARFTHASSQQAELQHWQ
jgi:hypothetical protein